MRLDVGSRYAVPTLAAVLSAMRCVWFAQETLKPGLLSEEKNVGYWKNHFVLANAKALEPPCLAAFGQLKSMNTPRVCWPSTSAYLTESH